LRYSYAKTIYILTEKGYIKELNITFPNIIKTRVKYVFGPYKYVNFSF